jgi:hypothetical protein
MPITLTLKRLRMEVVRKTSAAYPTRNVFVLFNDLGS